MEESHSKLLRISIPESETNFFVKINGAQVTFIKNDKGEAMAIIRHKAGLPDSEGKKLKTE